MKLQRTFLKITALPVVLLSFASRVYAENFGGVTVQEPTTFGQKIVELTKSIGMPVGGGILLFSVCIVAIKIMLSGVNPDKKANAMEGLMLIGIGGTILGGALFLAGLVLGIGAKLGG